MKSEQRITIFVVVLTAFITSFTGSALNLAIPDISAEFGINASLSGWIITIYTITVALISIPAGRAADIMGRKKILVTGLVLFCASSIASAFAPSIWILLISRGVQGIGAAMIFSTNTAILADAFPESRGKALGYSLAATYIGLSAGPFLGGVFNYNFGWRTVFVLPAVISFIALAASIKKLPAGKPQEKSGGRGSRKLQNVLGHVTFLDRKAYICSSAAALINYGTTFVVSYLLSIYLQVVAGHSSQTAGMILLIQPVIISVLSPFAGKISDSVSPFKLSAIGMAVCTAGIAIGLPIEEHRGLWLVIIVLATVGAGSALFSSPNTNAVMSCIDKKDYSTASSTLSAMRAAGNSLSMLLVSAVSSIYIGSNQLKQAAPEMVMITMDTVLWICLSVSIPGIILARIKTK